MNQPSLCLSVNFYNDVHAMRGLLELGARYFDHIFTINSGPGGARSSDGSIELAESFGATVVFDDIQKGFGHIRSRLIHECGCEWAMILDADERFHPHLNVMECSGSGSWSGPDDPNIPSLTVSVKRDVIDQGAHVKNLIRDPALFAIRATRRHWFDFSMRKPSQNWMTNQDHQLRIVRNHPDIGYVKHVVMHERLLDSRTKMDPKFAIQDPLGGPFIDHYHLYFRRTDPGHKEYNELNYQRLSKGEAMIP